MSARSAKLTSQGSVYTTSPDGLQRHAKAATRLETLASRSAIKALPSPKRDEQRQLSSEVFVTAEAAAAPSSTRRPRADSTGAADELTIQPEPVAGAGVDVQATGAALGGESSASGWGILCILAYIAAMVLAVISALTYVLMSLDVGGPLSTDDYVEKAQTYSPSNASKLPTDHVEFTVVTNAEVVAPKHKANITASTKHGDVFGTADESYS